MLQKVLICPTCKGSLDNVEDGLTCKHCNISYSKVNGKYLFIEAGKEEINDGLDRVKYYLKKYSTLYNLLIKIISPVAPVGSGRLKKFIRDYCSKQDKISINLGSGSSNVSDQLYNVDMFPYENVDVTCNIHHLPFKDNSIDSYINLAVLEHVADPQQVLSEIKRTLKPGGEIFCAFPFMQGFHASPYDFTRVTEEGMKTLFQDFNIINIGPIGGPTSGMLWVLQEWLAIILSFGIKPLHIFWYLFFMLITFPIKFLDYLLIYHPMAKNISSAFFVIAEKKTIT